MDLDLQDTQESLKMLSAEASSVPMLRQELVRQSEMRQGAEEAVADLEQQLLLLQQQQQQVGRWCLDSRSGWRGGPGRQLVSWSRVECCLV